MICNKCFHAKTSVTNSRAHKKTAQIWRRRQCPACQHTFTTYERIALTDYLRIQKGKVLTSYNPGILLASLYDALSHEDTEAAANAYWLTSSIEDDLALMGETVSTEDLKKKAHAALSRFNSLAGIQYALKHNLLEQIKRPRRR